MSEDKDAESFAMDRGAQGLQVVSSAAGSEEDDLKKYFFKGLSLAGRAWYQSACIKQVI